MFYRICAIYSNRIIPKIHFTCLQKLIHLFFYLQEFFYEQKSQRHLSYPPRPYYHELLYVFSEASKSDTKHPRQKFSRIDFLLCKFVPFVSKRIIWPYHDYQIINKQLKQIQLIDHKIKEIPATRNLRNFCKMHNIYSTRLKVK